MTTKSIIGYYKNWLLVEVNGTYFIVKRKERILFIGNEELVTKAFVLLIAGSITEEHLDMMRGAS